MDIGKGCNSYWNKYRINNHQIIDNQIFIPIPQKSIKGAFQKEHLKLIEDGYIFKMINGFLTMGYYKNIK